MSILTDQMAGKQKSGLVAAMLNLVIPGVGYMYCGRIFLGIIVFPFVILLIILSPFTLLFMWLILIVDGFLAAERYNRKLAQKIRSSLKTCPQCAEKVMPNAKVCRFCGFEFDVG